MPGRFVPPGMRFYSVYVSNAFTKATGKGEPMYSGWINGYDRGYALSTAKRILGHIGKVSLREMKSKARIQRALAKPHEDITKPPGQAITATGPYFARPYKGNGRRKRSARASGARRRRNAPVKHGARETFELAYYQGYAIEVAYRRELDGKLYSHKVETDAAEVYLAKHPVFGHCVIILDPSGKTPLWK